MSRQVKEAKAGADVAPARFRRCGDREHCTHCRTARWGVVQPRQGPPVENCWADWLDRSARSRPYGYDGGEV